MLYRKAHVLGILDVNRERNSEEVTSKTLKVGDVMGLKIRLEIVVLKWHEKHEVLIISTKPGCREDMQKDQISQK